MNNEELKKNLEKERKKQREDVIKINTFIRLDKSSASEIDKQIEQTYLSLQKNIKFVCTNKDLMNSMLDELDYYDSTYRCRLNRQWNQYDIEVLHGTQEEVKKQIENDVIKAFEKEAKVLKRQLTIYENFIYRFKGEEND